MKRFQALDTIVYKLGEEVITEQRRNCRSGISAKKRLKKLLETRKKQTGFVSDCELVSVNGKEFNWRVSL